MHKIQICNQSWVQLNLLPCCVPIAKTILNSNIELYIFLLCELKACEICNLVFKLAQWFPFCFHVTKKEKLYETFVFQFLKYFNAFAFIKELYVYIFMWIQGEEKRRRNKNQWKRTLEIRKQTQVWNKCAWSTSKKMKVDPWEVWIESNIQNF